MSDGFQLDVKLEMPRASKRNQNPHLTRVQYAVAGLATAIRRRVKAHGTEGYSGPSTTHFRQWIADGYKAIRGSSIQADGATMFLNSRAARGGVSHPASAFNLSGGMWDGMSVLQQGSNGARVQFRGRSVGQTPKWKVYKSDGRKKARTLKVSNALKAWTVLKSAGVNILALTPADMRGAEQYLEADVVKVLEGQLGAKFPKAGLNLTAKTMLAAAQSHRTQPVD